MNTFLKMITRVLFLVLGICAYSPSMAKAPEQSLDNIVAIVNDTVITETELNKSVHLAQSQMSSENMEQPPINTLRKQILQNMINQKVQLEAAEQSGIQIDEKELNHVIGRIAKENHISIDEFYQKIAQEGLSAKSYRKQIRESLALQHLQQREIASHINVAPEEIDEYIHEAASQNIGDKEYRIEDILVPLSDSPTPQEIAIAKKFAEDITGKLQSGARLADLSGTEIENLQTNDLNWRKLSEVPTAFTDTVKDMKKSSFAGPVQAANGFHIVHLVDMRTSKSTAPKLERQEVAQLLFQRKFEEALQTWITKVRGQAFIVIQDKAIA